MKKEITEMLDHLKTNLSRDKTYCCWSGIYNDEINKYIRGDLLFLNIVRFENNEFVYRRVSPCIIRQGLSGGSELLYATKNIIKITSGRRKGHILPLEFIYEDESFVTAGICKKLELGRNGNQLMVKRAGDKSALDLLSLLREEEDIKEFAIKQKSPKLFLVREDTKTNLLVRGTGSTCTWLQEQGADLENSDIQAAGMEIADKIKEKMLNGKVAYPFEHFYGKGVIAAEIDIIGEWFTSSISKVILSGITYNCK
jgi:hypothetical protein